MLVPPLPRGTLFMSVMNYVSEHECLAHALQSIFPAYEPTRLSAASIWSF